MSIFHRLVTGLSLTALMTAGFSVAGEAPSPSATGATINCNSAQTCAFAPQNSDKITLLSLSIHAELKAAPDMAGINFGVVTEARTAQAAMAANSERMNAVQAALKRQGVAEKAIQTSGLSLNPDYDYADTHGPVLKGYHATNQVSIRVEDIGRLGGTIDAVVAAGVNQIDAISFGLRDPSRAQDEARRMAISALMSQASLYAQSLGLKVRRVAQISEGYENPDLVIRPVARMAMMDKAAATPVAPGEVGISVSVSAVIELEK